MTVSRLTPEQEYARDAREFLPALTVWHLIGAGLLVLSESETGVHGLMTDAFILWGFLSAFTCAPIVFVCTLWTVLTTPMPARPWIGVGESPPAERPAPNPDPDLSRRLEALETALAERGTSARHRPR